MAQSLESVLTNFLNYYMSDCYTAMPAKVINTQSIEEGRVDVLPLANKRFRDATIQEYPALLNVPVMFYSTKKGGMTVPVSQGDTVFLVFSQHGLDAFKGGSEDPYDPIDYRFMDINDAVALLGLSTFLDSPNQPSKHKLPHSSQDVSMYNNLGDSGECEVRLLRGGAVKITSPKLITQNTPMTENTGSMNIAGDLSVGTGATGAFTTSTGSLVVVSNGIITSIT